MIARSSSSMEPMASEPSAMAGCTPMAKATGRGPPSSSAILLELPEVLAERQVNDVRSRPWIISRL